MMYGCVPKYLVATALAVSLSLGQPLLAQESAGSPVALRVEDVVPLTGFPADAVTDVLGVRIGMAYEEARQAILAADFPMLENAGDYVSDDKYAPKRVGFVFAESEVTPTFTWQDGFGMSFLPVRASAGLTLYHEREDFSGNRDTFASDEYFWVALGGPTVGGRVQEIYRRQKFAEAVDLETMLRSLDEKYGAPSHAKDRGSFGMELAWYFKGGEQVMRSDRNGFLLTQRCKPFIPPASAASLYAEAAAGRWLGGTKDPRESKEMCEGAIYVRLEAGNVPKTVVALDIFVTDYLARRENAVAVQSQAEAEHDDWLRQSAGSTVAPKL
ncbi:MAG TPA: hypothetical protein PKY73_00330 [Hyphomonas sp.]|nr:hypothetical protein [Hyphomonas sp.]